MSFACVAALCGRVGGRVEIDGSSPDRTVLSTAGRSCRLVVRWPYPAGLRDSWAKACYFSDLAGGFGCSLEFPGPTTLLEKQQNGNMRVPDSDWSKYYELPAPMAAEVPQRVQVLKTFQNQLPSRAQMELLSGPAARALGQFVKGWRPGGGGGGGGGSEGNESTPNPTLAFELKFRHRNLFWEKKWGINGTQSIPEAIASALNIKVHSKVQGGGHTDGSCSWNHESPAVKAYARTNIQRLFNTTPFAVLILRRGDRAHMFPKCSKAENVARVFVRHVRQGRLPLPRAVFLATNERDPAFLRTLRDALTVQFDHVVGEDALTPLEAPDNHFTFAADFAIKGVAAASMWFHPKQIKLSNPELCPEGP